MFISIWLLFLVINLIKWVLAKLKESKLCLNQSFKVWKTVLIVNTKYITSRWNTTKFIVLCCTICYTTTCFGPFFRPSSGCIQIPSKNKSLWNGFTLSLAKITLHTMGTCRSKMMALQWAHPLLNYFFNKWSTYT